MQTNIIFTGIGSRSTPYNALVNIEIIGQILGWKGWILRSGGADGADLAFEKGAIKVEGPREIYLPWPSFNQYNRILIGEDRQYDIMSPSIEAFQLTSLYHPNWDNLSRGVKCIHARNAHQVLGRDLKTPSNVVICWTEGGKKIGGTAQAMRIAEDYDIPIVNLAVDDFEKVREYVG